MKWNYNGFCIGCISHSMSIHDSIRIDIPYYHDYNHNNIIREKNWCIVCMKVPIFNFNIYITMLSYICNKFEGFLLYIKKKNSCKVPFRCAALQIIPLMSTVDLSDENHWQTLQVVSGANFKFGSYLLQLEIWPYELISRRYIIWEVS